QTHTETDRFSQYCGTTSSLKKTLGSPRVTSRASLHIKELFCSYCVNPSVSVLICDESGVLWFCTSVVLRLSRAMLPERASERRHRRTRRTPLAHRVASLVRVVPLDREALRVAWRSPAEQDPRLEIRVLGSVRGNPTLSG